MYCGGTFALSVITFNALDFGSRGLGSSPGRVTVLSYNSNSAALHLGLQMGTSRLWGKRHQEWVQQSQTLIPKMQIFTIISNEPRYVLGQVTLRYFIMCSARSKKIPMGLMRRATVYWIFDYNRKLIADPLIYITINCGNSVLNLWLKAKAHSGSVSLHYDKMWLQCIESLTIMYSYLFAVTRGLPVIPKGYVVFLIQIHQIQNRLIWKQKADSC